MRIGEKASKVARCTESGEIIKIYDSAKETEHLDGYDAKTLRDSIKLGKPYKGFIWKYTD